MAPIFASPDIAALVAAFPPPSPTKDQPSLVRSLSGNGLVSSQKILNRFRILLEEEPKRIRLSALPLYLGVESFDWLYECCTDPIIWSKDKQAIVTRREFAIILAQLQSRAQDAFTDLTSYAALADIALESLDCPETDQSGLCRLSDRAISRLTYVGTPSLVESTKSRIRSCMLDAKSEKVDLSHALHDVPEPVLHVLVNEVHRDMEDLDSTLIYEKYSIVYIPGTYATAQEDRRKAAYESTLVDLANHLDTAGFCHLNDETATNVVGVCSKYGAQHPDSSTPLPLYVEGYAAPKAIVLQSVLNDTLGQLKSRVRGFATKLRQSNGGSIDPETEALLVEASAKPQLAALLLRGNNLKVVTVALQSAITELNLAERSQFGQMFQETVLAPVHLYAAGIDIVQDATLKQHLDEYLGEHFRREVVPNFVNLAREHQLLSGDKSRLRDAEKLLQYSAETKDFTTLPTVNNKFARKQKIDHPSSTQIAQIKHRALQQKLKAMSKMSRGSDVLQNLIWLLLAQKNGGLFISSGRDTRRMIKQYQLVGDTETTSKLEKWRDMLKGANEQVDDLQEMKEMAMRALQEIHGAETANGVDETVAGSPAVSNETAGQAD